jgi:hypothetical protein
MKQGILTYFKDNKGAQEVFASFSSKASIRIITDLPEDVLIHQSRGKVYASKFIEEQKPDVTFNIPDKAVQKVLSEKHENSQDFLDHAIEVIMDPGIRKDTDIKIHIGLIKIVAYGYLKILKMGGPKFLYILKENGLDSIKAVKKTLSKLIN